MADNKKEQNLDIDAVLGDVDAKKTFDNIDSIFEELDVIEPQSTLGMPKQSLNDDDLDLDFDLGKESFNFGMAELDDALNALDDRKVLNKPTDIEAKKELEESFEEEIVSEYQPEPIEMSVDEYVPQPLDVIVEEPEVEVKKELEESFEEEEVVSEYQPEPIEMSVEDYAPQSLDVSVEEPEIEVSEEIIEEMPKEEKIDISSAVPDIAAMQPEIPEEETTELKISANLEDKLRKNISWYSGELRDKTYEISNESMPEFLDADNKIKVLHITVDSGYGWNVFFDNGVFMNIRDLKEYQERNGKLPFVSGKIIYGNRTSSFEKIERIVVYEKPKYYSYEVK